MGKKKSKSDKKKIAALFTRFVTYGLAGSSQKFKKLHGPCGIYELKPTDQIRLLGFFPPKHRGVFVITHGFLKQRSGYPATEIERAEDMRREFLKD